MSNLKFTGSQFFYYLVRHQGIKIADMKSLHTRSCLPLLQFKTHNLLLQGVSQYEDPVEEYLDQIDELTHKLSVAESKLKSLQTDQKSASVLQNQELLIIISYYSSKFIIYVCFFTTVGCHSNC